MMHSKWIDCGVNVAAFHLQSDRYKGSMPESYGKYPELDLTKSRFRNIKTTADFMGIQKGTWYERLFFRRKKKKVKHSNDVPQTKKRETSNYPHTPPRSNRRDEMQSSRMKSFTKRIPISETSQISHGSSDADEEEFLNYESRLDGGIRDEKSSLFLQELTHLLSLLSAVSLSTLRHDMEFAETPLGVYQTKREWPPVDPDHPDAKIIRDQHIENSWLSTFMMYVFGYTRSKYHRTLYNATRPFKVIGGISDAEAMLLLEARGQLAKVTLVLLWLQEFITRESMNGSFGNVAPPIISRCHQSSTDGFDSYNQARKIAYTPFPFPHAQITTYYVVVACCILPMLFLSFSSDILRAGILNFLSLLCFTGLHEVARELESPFRNAPNDIPLNNYQAQFNEALICLCAGYHPDSMWELPEQSTTRGNIIGLSLVAPPTSPVLSTRVEGETK